MGDLLQPWHLILLFAFVLAPLSLVPMIFYLLTLQKALNKCAATSRTMEPGLVWLMLVPIFNLVWHFFVVMGLAKSLASELASRGIASPEQAPGQSIGLAMCICACCCVIPLLGLLAALACLVLWIMYWVKIADYSRMLGIPQVALPSHPPQAPLVG